MKYISMANWFDEIMSFDDKIDEKRLTGFAQVENLHIRNNVVSGDVFGWNTSEYAVIRFKTFTRDEKEILKEFLEDENITRQILQHKVPEELFSAGVKIYPDSSNDFMVECSCFDCEESLCPHVIAVLRELKKVMLKDPFVIFSIRDFDLNKAYTVPVKSVGEILSHNFKSGGSGELTDLKELSDFLISSNRDDYLNSIYNELFKSLIEDIEDLSSNLLIVRDITLNIDCNYLITNIGKVNDELTLFKYLINLRSSYWCDLFDLTLTLLKNNAIMPELFKISKNMFSIRWIPSFFDENVLSYVEKFYRRCPSDFITLNDEMISKENQVIIAVSLIMKGFIEYHFDLFGYGNINTYFNPLLFELFFEDYLMINSYAKLDLIRDVATRLSVFHIKESPSNFVLNFTAKDDHFEGVFKIMRDNDMVDIDEGSVEELKILKTIHDVFKNNNVISNEFGSITLSRGKFLDFMDDYNDFLYYLNVECRMPFEIRKGDVRLKLNIDFEGDDYPTVNDFNDFNWNVSVGGKDFSIEEFNRLTQNPNSLIRVEDKLYSVDKNKVTSFKNDLLFLPDDFSGFEILQMALLGRYRNLKFDVEDKFKKLFSFSTSFKTPHITGKLRPYQKTGFSWLIQNIKSGFGSILADDMGLGKTLQVLTAILYLKEHGELTGQVLIIAPTTLLSNWENEINKFTPDLTYDIFHGAERKDISQDADIVLTSFGILRVDVDKFLLRTWFLCVVDEAQNIKNPSAKQTKAIKSLYTLNRIALTGTPIENRLLDYWSIFDFTNKGFLSSQKDFKKQYVNEISRDDSHALNNLKTITRPFILRRLKTDREIISELPDKNVNDIYCTLTRKQKLMYDEVLNSDFESLKESEGIARRGNILKLITSLKQICNHPSQFDKSLNVKSDMSGKAELLLEILGNIMEVGEKVIIFTQYVKMGEILEKLILKRFRKEVLFLRGSLTRSQRKKLLDKFQNDSSFPILIATLKTGGVGLNLTAANNVIHYDLWWNPAVENQATDRVYRIGQTSDVMVYRFITKGTLEEKIDMMIKDKLELAGKAIDSQETFITEMSDDELMEMLSLRL